MEYRRPSITEMQLIECLFTANDDLLRYDVSHIRVDNGGSIALCSFRLSYQGIVPECRGVVCHLSCCRFLDDDGVDVIVTLYGNEKREPFEVDVWKTDSTPVRTIGKLSICEE